MNTVQNEIGIDVRSARKLIAFIDEFKKRDAKILLDEVIVFLLVAGNTGISLKEIEKRTGLPRSTTNRHVLHLSEIFKKGEPGLNLVETYEDPEDRRTKRVRLKPMGIKMFNDVKQTVWGE